MSNTPSKFRRIYVVAPTTHDLSPLKKYSDNLSFLLSGYESMDDLLERLKVELAEFDPEIDAIVPMGKIVPNVMLGHVLNGFPQVILGIFVGGDIKDYVFEKVLLNGHS